MPRHQNLGQSQDQPRHLSEIFLSHKKKIKERLGYVAVSNYWHSMQGALGSVSRTRTPKSKTTSYVLLNYMSHTVPKNPNVKMYYT